MPRYSQREFYERSGQAWTAEEEEKLRSIVSSGGTTSRASYVLKRPLEGIRDKARKLGLTFKARVLYGKVVANYTPEEDRQLFELSSLPWMTLAQAAKKLGRSRHSIHQRAKLLGISWGSGYHTLADAAREAGVHENTAYGWSLDVPWISGNMRKNGSYKLTDDVYDRLVNYLRMRAENMPKLPQSLTENQKSVLGYIYSVGGICPRAVLIKSREFSKKSSSTISDAISRLDRRGYLNRRPYPSGLRGLRILIVLTSSGKAIGREYLRSKQRREGKVS